MSNLSNDYDVRLATLKKLGGDMTKKYATIYDVDLAILDKIGQGGGGGGSTVWGDIYGDIKDQKDLIDLISQSGGGSLTPEQEEILEKLSNTSGGAYYTTEIGTNGSYISVDGYDTNTKNYSQIGDDFYMYTFGYIFKYNPSTFSFTKLNEEHINNLNPYNRFWKDKSGRVHFGFNYEFDLNTLQMTDHMVSPYSTSSEANYISVIIGKYGIYNLWGRDYVVFNEAEDRFDSEVKNLPEPSDGQYYNFGDSFYKSLQNVDGRLISIFDNMTFEVIENPDSTINIIKIDDFWDFNNMPFSINIYSALKYINGSWYFPADSSLYKYTDGEWVVVNDNFNFGQYNLPQCNSYNGLMFGPMNFPQYDISPLIINYTDEPVKSTSWTPAKNFAVDLVSNQSIGGQKTFNESVEFKQTVVLNSILSSSGNSIDLYSQKNTIINADYFVKLQKNTLVGGDFVASKEDTIQNSEISYPGLLKKEVVNNLCGDLNWYCYAVFNNKVYHNSVIKYVFDGENAVIKDNWYPLDNSNMSQCAKITSNRFFIVNTNNFNIYELVGDEWVLRLDTNTYGTDQIIPFEDTLVCGMDGKKLNTTTWEWEDWLGHGFNVQNMSAGVFEHNNITYQITDSNLNKFNPETGQFEEYVAFINEWGGMSYSQGNRFIHNGNIYINASGNWYLVDLDSRTIIKQENILVEGGYPVFSLNGKTYTYENCQIQLLYDVNYTKPALPNNGLDYSLTAKSTNGKVEYSYAGIWSGTQAEWDALPADVQNSIKIALITE